MDVNKLHDRMTSNPGISQIKATWIERFVTSPISFWCDLYAPDTARDSLDAYTEHLFTVGQEHQSATVKESYPEAIQQFFTTEDEGFRMTLDLMLKGEKIISNMPIMSRPLGLEGRPDILLRNDEQPSDFGHYSYEVLEIKSARNIKPAHFLQAAVYNRILGELQGYVPPMFYFINRDRDVQGLEMAQVRGQLEEIIEAIRGVMDGEYIDPTFNAGEWPWESYVNQLAIKIEDISLIPGVGPSIRKTLIGAGFDSLDSIASTSQDQLTQIKGIGYPTATNYITSAQAIKQGLPVRRGGIDDTRYAKTAVFIDLEGTDPRFQADGLEIMNYLIGAVVRREGGPADYTAFFANSIESEKDNLEAFFRWAGTLEDPVFYHWHHYERTHLNKMSDFYGLGENIRSVVLGNLVDLSPITTKAFAFPTYGQSLKDIAKFLGFQWRQEDVGALTSVILYFQYVASGGTNEAAKQRILDYNEDDCRATIFILDWLKSQQQ